MKAYLHKLTLILLIVVLCSNCMLPAFGAEEISGRERQYLEEGIEASKNSFFQIYRLLWKEHNLDQKLAAAIDRGVDEKMNSMMWGTQGIQTLLVSSVSEEAQEMVINAFNPDYEEFMQDLERRFGDENNRHVALFYKNIAAEAMAESDNPMIKAYIRQTTSEILKGGADALQAKISESLTKKKYIGFFQAGTTVIGIAATLFRQKISSFIIQKIGATAIGKAVGAKFVEAAIPVAGQIMAIWGAVSLMKTLWSAPDELKDKLKTGLSEAFITKQPSDYWELMEREVRTVFNEAWSTLRLNLDDANDFANDPEVIALMESRRRGGQTDEIEGSAESD